MAILVTGGTGYIGSHTCVELLNEGYEVVVIDNYSNSQPAVKNKVEEISGKQIKVYEGDVLDEKILNKIFDENDITAVIHFAGLKAVGESVQKPIEYYSNNISGTLVLCDVMRAHGCKKIVFSSSATVYGDNPNVPFKEDYPTSATNPYGQTKLMVEQILTDIVVADPSWSCVLLRYFNPVGAHSSGLIGEVPKGTPNNLMPYIAQVATGQLPYLRVYGDDYDTPDGTGVRDYLHVVDLALGHIKALEYAENNAGAKPINLGTGKGNSVLEVLNAYAKACGKELAHKIEPRRAGDIATCYADTTLSQQLLGWKAEKTLDDMCVDSWKFVLSHNK